MPPSRLLPQALLTASLLAATAAAHAACTDQHSAPPASAMRVPVQADAPMASHTEVFELDLPAADFNARLALAPLEALIPGTAKLPGVVGTRALTERPFGSPGAPRLVCLSDGSTVTEEVLVSEPGRLFRYAVWNYATEAAKPLQYGVGSFALTPLGPNRTRVEWTYAFRLNEDRFPGALGALGRWLLRVTFLDGDYAELMRSSATAMTRELAAR